MVNRDELIEFIKETIGSELLEKAKGIDEVANGVQVMGGSKVNRVVLGVSLNEEFLVKAVEKQSNFCIFHHGFDPRTYKSLYSLSSQKRLGLIFKNNMTICGFHYSLDAQPKIGNNATIIKRLGAQIREPLFEEWGYTGSFDKPQEIHNIAHKCQELFDNEVFVVAGGKDKVKKIGVVSGAGKPYDMHIAEMEEKGVELFISGETSESTPHKLLEAGINYFVCGHYATEVFGVQELGKRISANFKDQIAVEFIDIKNPI